MSTRETTSNALSPSRVSSSHRPARHSATDRIIEGLRRGGSSSQAALARRLDLSPATVSAAVKALQEQGVVEVSAVNGRERLVSLVPGTPAICVVRVSVPRVDVTLFDFEQQRRIDLGSPCDPGAPGADADVIARLIREICERAGRPVSALHSLGVAVQGPIETPSGMLTSWARLQLPGWLAEPVDVAISRRLGVPVVVDNDANLAALAEWTWGVGQGVSSFLYLLCGAGVGGGIVLDGDVYRGGDGLAGEIGHVLIDAEGPVCFCGNRGCLTTFVSEQAIVRSLGASSARQASLGAVIEHAVAGHLESAAVLVEAGRALGRGLATTTKLLAPSVIALGGPLLQEQDIVMNALLDSLPVRALQVVSPGLRIERAELGSGAASLGALAMVLRHRGQGLSQLPAWATHVSVEAVG